jgi:hypothetical protein
MENEMGYRLYLLILMLGGLALYYLQDGCSNREKTARMQAACDQGETACIKYIETMKEEKK